VSGTNSTAGFAAPTVVVGHSVKVTIVVEDQAGNPLSGLTRSDFVFRLSGGRSTGTFGSFTETATKGTYIVFFTGTRVGTASTLTVSISGVPIGSKPTVTVTLGSGHGLNARDRAAKITVVARHHRHTGHRG
jgi:hypothetical protein